MNDTMTDAERIAALDERVTTLTNAWADGLDHAAALARWHQRNVVTSRDLALDALHALQHGNLDVVAEFLDRIAQHLDSPRPVRP